MRLDLEAVQREAHKRVAELVNTVTAETVKYVIGDDDDEATLSQKATDKAVEGDYVGAMICEVAAKQALKAEPKSSKKQPRSKPMNNQKAKLTVHQDFLVETVDDMLCVTDEVVMKAGVYAVEVFHRDADTALVGIKAHGEFKSDLVVRIEEGVVGIRYMGDTVCATCGEAFTKKDIDGGRCLSCGSMIT